MLLHFFNYFITLAVILANVTEYKSSVSPSTSRDIIREWQEKYPFIAIDTATLAKNNGKLVYYIRPTIIQNQCTLEIQTVVHVDFGGTCELGFAATNGQKHPTLINGLSVQGLQSEAFVKEIERGLDWRIYAAPNTFVQIRYLAFLDSAGMINQNYYMPFPALFSEDYFSLKGISLFLIDSTTKAELDSARNIELHWLRDSSVSHLKYVNKFGEDQHIQSFRTSHDDFLNTLYCGGNDTKGTKQGFDISTDFVDSTATISLLTTGPFTDIHNKFLRYLVSIMRAERQFWRDERPLHYIASIISVDLDDITNTIGFSSKDCFVGFLSEKTTAVTPTVGYLISHEIMHKWLHSPKIPTHTLSGFGFCAVEGFTEYCSRLVLLQQNLISQTEYLKQYNEVLRLYYCSKAKNIQADSINKNFWTNLNYNRIPYYRGDILAHNWNAEIIDFTKGEHTFSDAFREMMRLDSVITDSSFARRLEPYIGRSVMPDIIKYMQQGQEIKPHPKALSFARLKSKKVPAKSAPARWIPQYYCPQVPKQVTSNKHIF
jgi:hypothetical protein